MGLSSGIGAYESEQQRKEAERAARIQAGGVEAAQEETRQATSRGRAALSGLTPEAQQIQSRINALTPLSNAIQGIPGAAPGAISNQIQDLQGQLEAARSPDPRQELLSGIQGQLGFTDTGFQGAQQTLNPLAAMAQPYLQEQQALLGMGGQDAYQQALSRVSDPLAAEQERAFLRNNAALGGVGGNALSALAEQTRARTEANIGNRLAQLGSASSPALNALQNISNLRLNQGLSMADIMGGGGRDLAAQETARRQALANLEIGQGSELSQLAQNLGTARAGGAAFRAQTQTPLGAGLTSGLNTATSLFNFM